MVCHSTVTLTLPLTQHMPREVLSPFILSTLLGIVVGCIAPVQV